MMARRYRRAVTTTVAVAAAIVAGVVGALLMASVAMAVALNWDAPAAAPPTAEGLPQPTLPAARLALGFVPPPVGSYRLERILQAPDGRVLDSDGSVHRLRAFTTGKVTLFSLVYTYCTDARGCPLAFAALYAMKSMVADDPALWGEVRVVSMSFDPQFDTPPMMRSDGGDDAVATGATPWYCLTAASSRDLMPVLDGFGQDVAVIRRGAPGVRAPVLSIG